jgi:hypothetical protein
MDCAVPNRILREGILTSERVNALSWPAEVFYRRLISVVDDFGRYYAKPELMRAACYPLKLDIVGNQDVVKWLAECARAGLVRTYTVDGKDYLELADFKQQVRAKDSKFPQMLGTCVADATHTHSSSTASAHLDVVGDGVEGDTVRATPGFERFWAAWPSGERKQAKGRCLEVWKRHSCEADVEAIVSHVYAMQGSKDWKEGFIPAPLVYLNQKRWQGADSKPKVRKVAL